MRLSSIKLSFFVAFLILPSCTTEQEISKPKTSQVPQLIQTSFSQLSGWQDDTIFEAVAPFHKSCQKFNKQRNDQDIVVGNIKTKVSDWKSACARLGNVDTDDHATVRRTFEDTFHVYSVQRDGQSDGLFTGYYEPGLKGSMKRHGDYQTPLRLRPNDLVTVNLGEFRPELKGQRIAGRVVEGQLKPYEDRAAIEAGKMPQGVDKTLLWVDSPVDAFFLQVQGSGLIELDTGELIRVGYDGQNGHVYTAIGKELIARGELSKENVSMQSIREWLSAHPHEAQSLMNTNKSYVFFRQLDTDGPVGAEGVVLTPERSLAVDHSIWPYGLPIYIAADHPDGGEPLQRLMIAQDTGGAITGVVRGDYFWGHGESAAHNAGLMQSKGKMWVLIPKSAVQPQK